MYPPLELANQLNIADIPDTNKAKKYLLQMQNGDDLMLHYIGISSNFGTERYDGPYKDFSEYIHDQWRQLYKWATGYDPDRNVFNKSNRATVIDSLAGMVTCSKWGKYKRVYRFDPELELALATVDEIKIPLKMLDRLPFRSFYVEFAPDGIFAPEYHGCFAEVLFMKDTIGFRFVRLKSDLRSMSGTGNFHIDHTQEEPYVIVKREDIDGKHTNDPNGLRNDWEEFCFFILNAMIYLCASNADIKESVYKGKNPASKKEKKIIEDLKISDCGYVYGETIRLNKKQQKEREEKEETPAKSGKTRCSPRPHPVRASWQHYWKGSGDNKQRVLIFKDPYFTGSSIKVATISKVEG